MTKRRGFECAPAGYTAEFYRTERRQWVIFATSITLCGIAVEAQQQNGVEAVVVKIYTAKIRNKNVIKGEKYGEKNVKLLPNGQPSFPPLPPVV